jgi:hypothetical protein
MNWKPFKRRQMKFSQVMMSKPRPKRHVIVKKIIVRRKGKFMRSREST